MLAREELRDYLQLLLENILFLDPYLQLDNGPSHLLIEQQESIGKHAWLLLGVDIAFIYLPQLEQPKVIVL